MAPTSTQRAVEQNAMMTEFRYGVSVSDRADLALKSARSAQAWRFGVKSTQGRYAGPSNTSTGSLKEVIASQ